MLGMGELLKFCISLAAIAMRTSASEAPEGPIGERLSYLLRHSAKMAVPAVLYLIMNTLGLYAIACTEPEPLACRKWRSHGLWFALRWDRTCGRTSA